ncbi:unnamed protein product, partial [Ectocarpus fasciculatus]
RCDLQDIAGVLEEHSASVSEDERRTIDEAVSVARNFRRPSGSRPPGHVDATSAATREETSGNGRTSSSSSSSRSNSSEDTRVEATAAGDGAIAARAKLSTTALSLPSPPPLAATSVLGTTATATTASISTTTTAATATTTTLAPLSTAIGEHEYEPEEAGRVAAGEEDGLDMSDFEDLLLDHLKTTEYPPGEFVFREGDAPDGGLYFIVEGRVDVLVNSAGWNSSSSTGDEGGSSPDATNADSRPPTPTHHAHTRVASMGPGDFFGEGGVVSAQPRGESVRAVTPVKVINVSLASCHRMIDAPGKVSSSLRRVALSRALFRAKNVVRAVHSVTKRLLGPGEAVFRQGDRGSSLFTVEKGELNVVKEHSGVHRTVARLSPGSLFGEMALMTAQPRSASVVCAAEGGCAVEEISGDDFARLLMARRTGFRRDVVRMLRARQFRHGVYKLLTELGSEATFSDEELRQVFDRADTAKSGTLSLAELKAAFLRADPLLHESAVEEIMTMLDLDAVGSVSFEEFLKIIRWDP